MPVRATRAFAGATAGAAAEMTKADMLTRDVALLVEEGRRPTGGQRGGEWSEAATARVHTGLPDAYRWVYLRSENRRKDAL